MHHHIRGSWCKNVRYHLSRNRLIILDTSCLPIMTDNWEEYFSKLQLEPYLVFVFTASTRSSTDLHIILLIHNTACFVGGVVRSHPPWSNIFSKFPRLCWTTVHQSFNYQMMQWGPSIRKIPVALQFWKNCWNGGSNYTWENCLFSGNNHCCPVFNNEAAIPEIWSCPDAFRLLMTPFDFASLTYFTEPGFVSDN